MKEGMRVAAKTSSTSSHFADPLPFSGFVPAVVFGGHQLFI
jgi:hypothetical protein